MKSSGGGGGIAAVGKSESTSDFFSRLGGGSGGDKVTDFLTGVTKRPRQQAAKGRFRRLCARANPPVWCCTARSG